MNDAASMSFNTYRVLTDIMDPLGLWQISIFAGMFAMIIALARRYNIGWEATALWAYCLVKALYLVEFPTLPFGDATRAFQASAGQSFAQIALIPLAILMLDERPMWKFFRVIAVVKIALIWITPYWTPHIPYMPWLSLPGALISSSFDQALLALYLPFAPAWIAIPSLVTILTHHGSTALMVLAVESAAIFFSRMHPLFATPTFLFSASALFAVARHHAHDAYLDGLDRIQHWKLVYNFWKSSPYYVTFGVGAGSFMWVNRTLEKFSSQGGFQTAHSDWIQLGFDFGSVGVLLALLFLVRLAWSCRKDTLTLAGILGGATFMLTYHPLHYMPGIFLVSLVIKRALYFYSAQEDDDPLLGT